MDGIQAVKSEFSRIQTYVGLTVAALILFTIIKPLITYFTSPLRSLHLPGPSWAKYTKLPLTLRDLAGFRGLDLHEYHLKYGPVVQIGPDEITFLSNSAILDIYTGASACEISDIYNGFGNKGQMFISRDPLHRDKKKRITHLFSIQSMNELEPLMHELCGKLYDVISKATGKPIDVLHWVRMLNLDLAGEVFFGKPFGGLSEDPLAVEYAHMIDFVFLYYALRESTGPILKYLRLISSILPKDLKSLVLSSDFVDDYSDETVTSYVKRYGRDSGRRDLLTKMLNGDPKNGTEPLSDAAIKVEVNGLTFAAVDTTSNGMSYLLYELSCNPEWQDRLRTELWEANVIKASFANNLLKDLPVLNACIHETLRLHPPAFSSLPRITPPEGFTVDGLWVPGNVRVSASPFDTQRNPEVFPNPDKFDPARWIVEGADYGTQDMRDATLTWGKGSRACLGRTMATMNMRIMAATVLSRLKVRLASEQTHDDMTHTDHFTLIPKGKKCMLIVEHAE